MNQIDIIRDLVTRIIPVTIATGVVQRVTPNAVFVGINGGQATVPARYGRGTQVEVGDDCVLIGIPRSSIWILVTAYPSPSAGSPQSVSPTPTHLLTSKVRGNIAVQAGSLATNSTTAYRTILSDSIITRGGNLIVGFAGYCTSGSTNNVTYRITINEVEVHSNQSVAGTAPRNLSFSLPVDDIGPGKHALTLEAIHSSAAITLTGKLWAIEV